MNSDDQSNLSNFHHTIPENDLPQTKPRLVFIILLLLILGYIGLSGYFLKTIGIYRNGLGNGQLWRFISAMFAHVDSLHLLVNCVALLIFGIKVERFFGRTRFLAIYFLSGLFGGLCSFLFIGKNVSVGASGAIFGLISAHVHYFYKYREQLGEFGQKELGYGIGILIANVFYSFTEPNVDFGGHMGGLIAGFSLAFFLAPQYRLQEGSLKKKWVDDLSKQRVRATIFRSLLLFSLLTWFAIPAYPQAIAVKLSHWLQQISVSIAPQLQVTPIQTITTERKIMDIVFSNDSDLLTVVTMEPSPYTSVTKPSETQVWQINSNEPEMIFRLPTEPSRVAFDPENALLLIDRSTLLHVWDLNNNERLDDVHLDLGEDSVNRMYFSSNGDVLIIQRPNGGEAVNLWRNTLCSQITNECIVPTLALMDSNPTGVDITLSYQKDMIAGVVCGRDSGCEIRIWHVSDGKLLTVTDRYADSVKTTPLPFLYLYHE